MKRIVLIVFSLCVYQMNSYSQKITFSEYSKRDSRNMFFEILGKFDTSFLVYKGINRKHYITSYSNEMKITKTTQLDFIPEKTFNVDFIAYPASVFIIYQYEKNNIVYCKAAKVDAQAKTILEPILLDTTKIGFFNDNKIYSTVFSEDKQKILVYKRQVKNDNMTLVTKLFDVNLQMLDSTRQMMKYDDRKEEYSELYVGNDGNFIFAKETRRSYRDNSSQLNIILHKPGIDTFRNYSISLNDKYIDDIAIKIDNLNKHYLVNSFYHNKRQGNIEGLFTSLIDMTGEKPVKAVFNVFSDTLRNRMNGSGQNRFIFDNLDIRNTFVKKNGGFVLAAEDFYMETQINNIWNRRYFNSYMPGASYDYYMTNPYYYGYRPYSSLNNDQTVRYYYNDIVVLSLDSDLKLEWNSVINKKQYDVDDDNFMSFSNMNAGGEIHFLFIDKDRYRQIISDHSVFPDGKVKRYATLKSNETGYGFMPKLAKQVGARQMIIPYIYLGYVAFAKVDFTY